MHRGEMADKPKMGVQQLQLRSTREVGGLGNCTKLKSSSSRASLHATAHSSRQKSFPTDMDRVTKALLIPDIKHTSRGDAMVRLEVTADEPPNAVNRWEGEEATDHAASQSSKVQTERLPESKATHKTKRPKETAKSNPARRAIISYNSMGEKSVRWVQVEPASANPTTPKRVSISEVKAYPPNQPILNEDNGESVPYPTEIEQEIVDLAGKGWVPNYDEDNHLEKAPRTKPGRRSKRSVAECMVSKGRNMSWVSEPLVRHLKLSIGFRPYWPTGYCWCEAAMALTVIEIEDPSNDDAPNYTPAKCSKCGRKSHTLELTVERYRPHFSARTILDIIEAVYSKLSASAHSQLFKKAKGRKQLADEDQPISVFAALFSVMKSRYGMKNVVQTKIKQLMVSMCHFIHDVDAIAVFGEFLAMHAREGSTRNDHVPDELVALCVCCYTWLYSRQMVMPGNAIISTTAKESSHDNFKPCDPSCGAKHWQFVSLSCALLCAQENLMYPLVNPGFLRNILLFTGDYAQEARWLPSLEIEGGPETECRIQSTCHSLRQRWIEIHRFLRLIVGEWRQQNESFRMAERVLFLQVDEGPDADGQVTEKLRLILSCLVFYDHDRVGVMAVTDFTNILRRLRYLWPNERMTEVEAAETMEVSITFENAIRASCARFADTERDGQLCYLDFWAMLYVVGMKTRSMIKFREIPSFCRDYKLEVAPQLQEIILSFMEQSCTVLLPQGLLLGKSSFDQKATKQHVRRIAGLHDGMIDLTRSLKASISATDLIASRYDETNNHHWGLYVEPSTLMLQQNASATAADRFRPIMQHSSSLIAIKGPKSKVIPTRTKVPAFIRASSLSFDSGVAQIPQLHAKAEGPREMSSNSQTRKELHDTISKSTRSGCLYVQFHDVTPRHLQFQQCTNNTKELIETNGTNVDMEPAYTPRVENKDSSLDIPHNCDSQVLQARTEDISKHKSEENEEIDSETEQPFESDKEHDDASTEEELVASARSDVSGVLDQEEIQSTMITPDSPRGASPVTRRRSSTTVIRVPSVEKDSTQLSFFSSPPEIIVPVLREQDVKERIPLRERSPLRDKRLRSASMAALSLSGNIIPFATSQLPSNSLRALIPSSESEPPSRIVSSSSEMSPEIAADSGNDLPDQNELANIMSPQPSSSSKPQLISSSDILDSYESNDVTTNPATNERGESEPNKINGDCEGESSKKDGEDDNSHGFQELVSTNSNDLNQLQQVQENETQIQDKIQTASIDTEAATLILLATEEETHDTGKRPDNDGQVEAEESSEQRDTISVNNSIPVVVTDEVESPTSLLATIPPIYSTSTLTDNLTGKLTQGCDGDSTLQALSESEPQHQNSNVVDTLMVGKPYCSRVPDISSPRTIPHNDIYKKQVVEPNDVNPSRPATAQTHAFRFSQQPNFRSNAQSFNNPFRFAQWSPRNDSDSDSDKGERSEVSKESRRPFISPVIDDDDDEEGDGIEEMELRLSETSRRRIRPPPRLKHQLSATRLSAPGCNGEITDTNMISNTSPASSRPPSSRKYRLDERAHRALYGDDERLEAGLVVGPEVEAMIQQKWISIFAEAEVAMFSPVKQAIERKLEQQRLIEESQSLLRRKRQEEAEKDALRMQLTRGEDQGSKSSTSMQTGSPNLRHERLKRESCHQLQVELEFGECVRGECQDASDTQYFHFHYSEDDRVGSIITLTLHIISGNADMYVSTNTRVPSSTDYTWRSMRSNEVSGKSDDEGFNSPLVAESTCQRIVLYPPDILKARSLADNCGSAHRDSETQQNLLSFYISVVARTSKTIFSISVMRSGQKTEPSRAMQAVDYFIDRFNAFAESFAGSSSSSSRLTVQVPGVSRYATETREHFLQRIKHSHQAAQAQDNTDVGLASDLPTGRTSTQSEIDNIDTEVESFQHLLTALSSKAWNGNGGSNKRASFLLAGPSDEQREFVQDEEERLQLQLSGQPNDLVPDLTLGKRVYSLKTKLTKRRSRGRTPPNQRLSPLKHQPATGSAASLHVAKFAPRPIAYSLSKLDGSLSLAPLGASASVPLLGASKRTGPSVTEK